MTTVTLEAVVAAVQDIALTVDGIRDAYDSIPSKLGGGPTVITYPESGAIDANAAGFATELHVIAVELIVGGADYAQTYKLGLPLLTALLRKIEEAPTLGGTVQTYGGLGYTFDRDNLIWTIRISDVKIQHTW
jgi:hypothetical protein